MGAEKFVLVPHEMYRRLYNDDDPSSGSTQAVREDILGDKNLLNSVKTKLVTAAQRMPTVDVDMDVAETPVKDVNRSQGVVASSLNPDETFATPQGVSTPGTLPQEVLHPRAKIIAAINETFAKNIKKRRAQEILDILLKNKRVSIDPHTLHFVVDGSLLDSVDAAEFLHTLQVYNRRIQSRGFENLLSVANIPIDLVVNKYVQELLNQSPPVTAVNSAAHREHFESFVSANWPNAAFGHRGQQRQGEQSFDTEAAPHSPLGRFRLPDDEESEEASLYQYTFE